MTILEDFLGLHQTIEINYVVSGYQAVLRQDTDAALLCEGETHRNIRGALENLRWRLQVQKAEEREGKR
jgi:hypothetical protein